MTVSGDGLIHEVINGLLNRKDWNTAVDVPDLGQVRFRDTVTLGVVPGGSGNGMIKSLLHRAGEEYGITEAAYRLIKGNSVDCDLTELVFEQEPAKKVYSFLSFAWSIFADIDINSEACRCCGPCRFTCWGIWRVLFMKQYWGSIRYIGEDTMNRRIISKRNMSDSLLNKS